MAEQPEAVRSLRRPGVTGLAPEEEARLGLLQLAKEFSGAGSRDELLVAVALDDLAEMARELCVGLVCRERQLHGMPWTYIGRVFRTSRQTVQKRFGPHCS